MITRITRKQRLWKISLLIGLSLALGVGFWPLVSDRVTPQVHRSASETRPQSVPTPTVTPTPVVVKLTLNQVVEESQNPDSAAFLKLPQDKVRQILLGGDVMMGRSVGFQMTRKRDFGYPFLLIQDQLRAADLTVVNLENPVIENCPITQEGMIFCSSPGTATALKNAGVDVVNLANNHTLNHGRQGLQSTVEFLNLEKVAYTGLGEPAVVDVRGLQVAILGYLQLGGGESVLAEATPVKLRDDITKLKYKNPDVVMVTFHWGAEYQLQPVKEQRQLAYAAIDAGADVVFGHHPHWVQGMEFYKGKPIFYSLGNLVFDQTWSWETREGLVAELNFYEDTLAGIVWRPIFMEELGQPQWSQPGYGNTILAKIESASRVLEATQEKVAGK